MTLTPFELVNWFSAAEGRFDISLSHSDCEPLAVSDLLDAQELTKFTCFDLGYGSFMGLEDLRNEVAQQYTTVTPQNVLIFSGASEAIYTFMRTMLNPGEEVIVQTPIFHSLYGVAQSIGCKMVEWRPADDMTCSYDVSSLLALCNKETKLVVFNFPHNPTGQMISESDLQSVVEMARHWDTFLLSDEQFRLLEMPSIPTLPAACDLYDKAISVTGVSKTHGLGGLRIGWLATRAQTVLETAKQYRFYTTEMTNTPCQFLARLALERGGEILQRNRSRIVTNVERLRSFAEQHQSTLTLHPPQAGTMAVVEQKTGLSSTEFCERLLEQERVFLVPCEVMGMSDCLLRFGLGRDDFAEGLERLGNFLNQKHSNRGSQPVS